MLLFCAGHVFMHLVRNLHAATPECLLLLFFFAPCVSIACMPHVPCAFTGSTLTEFETALLRAPFLRPPPPSFPEVAGPRRGGRRPPPTAGRRPGARPRLRLDRIPAKTASASRATSSWRTATGACCTAVTECIELAWTTVSGAADDRSKTRRFFTRRRSGRLAPFPTLTLSETAWS